MTTLARLAIPRHVLHLRRSRVMIPAPASVPDPDSTVTWNCYGTFDRLLLTGADSLAPPNLNEPAWCSVGQGDEILFPLGNWEPDALLTQAMQRALIGVHHIKFERTWPPRPDRFDTARLGELSKILGDGDEQELFLCAGLHWHEWVLLTISDDVECIFKVGLTLRRVVPRLLGRGFGVLHSHTTVANRFVNDNDRRKINGACRASLRIGGITDRPAAMFDALDGRTREFLQKDNVKIDWDIVPLIGHLDFAIRLKEATPFATIVGLIEHLRDGTADMAGRVRLTETTLLPARELLDPASDSGPMASLSTPPVAGPRGGGLCDQVFQAAVGRIATQVPGSDAVRDLQSIMQYAEAMLADRLLAPAALDLINALRFLRRETLHLAQWVPQDAQDINEYHLAALALQRMAQRLEYALRSRTSTVGLLLPSSVHPAVLHGSHALHYRIIEALSAVPLSMLGRTWPGCVLVGWGNAIQLFEGATFGMPAAWFSETHRWWSLVHEVGHQVAVNERLVDDSGLKRWFESSWVEPFDESQPLDEKQRQGIETKLYGLALEVFADLYEFHFFYDRSWERYIESCWGQLRWDPWLHERSVDHLLRACCVAAYSRVTAPVPLTACIERVVADCPGENVVLMANPANKKRLQIAAERFQGAYDVLVARLPIVPQPDSADGSPLALLRQVTAAGTGLAGQVAHQGGKQAHIILRMAEWYRDNRHELSEKELEALPSIIRR